MTHKLLMLPKPSEASVDTSNSINQIVLRLEKHLPAFGYELTEDEGEADLIVGHAGQGARASVDVAHCHGLYPTSEPGALMWHWAANRAVTQNLITARAITVPSQWVAEILRRDMHVDPHVIGWAIDPDEWQPPESHGGYVFWGKTRTDGVCSTSTLQALAARVPNQPFISTFGDGVSNVRTIGRQQRSAIKSYIREAAVYLADVKETFGIMTLEAMACGVPVLGYRWGGTADIVEHGVTGYLVEPGDVDGLIEGLAYCLKYRDVLGANARRVALAYTWERVAEQMAAVYDRALEPHVGPKVSVVIPVHNYARYVGDAIESVKAQETSFEVEIIVVDDASTDDSVGVANVVLAEEGLVIANPANLGVARTRNAGIAKARGEYVVCLDADDRLGNPHYIATLAGALDADHSLGIAFTGLTVMNEAGELGGVSSWPKGYDFDLQVEGRNQVPTCCMFQREAWRRAGGYRAQYQPAEDANLWLRIGALGYRAKQVVTDGWFHYRLHDNSLSSSVREGKKPEPNWRAALPWVFDDQRPFAADGQPRPVPYSWPVRNYDRPLVSVIVPCGPGHARYLPEALDSIEGQTERRWECVVVNDSGEPLDLGAFPWARVIETPGKMGASYARNRGIEASRAPFIAFLDADDIFESTFLSATLRAHQRHGRYIYTDWISLSKQGEFERHETPEYQPEDVFRRTSIHSINVLIPRRWLNDVGGFDEAMRSWEDVDLFMKLAAKGYCGERVGEPLVIYRYLTGFLREQGETVKDDLIALLRDRYREFIVEGKQVGCCGIPTKPAPGVSLADAGSDAVRVEYTGERVPTGQHTLIGSSTRQNYGQRARGDVFLVWRKDFEAAPDRFVELLPLQVETVGTPAPLVPTLLRA